MQNINGIRDLTDLPWLEWTRKDSEELVKLYLQDYYETLDEYYLREALQIAKEDGVNFELMMHQVRFQQA
ncbi:MAG: hypothetical protein D6732_17905 [Methanobacteriota archaeon]|nr:MAG: hypothetical protein D6732_17905 [Euryarchaeota archaeon]